MSPPKIRWTDLTPLQIEDALARADKALPAGDPAAAGREVTKTLAQLQQARQLHDAALDEATQTPEVRAVRITEPRHLDPASES